MKSGFYTGSVVHWRREPAHRFEKRMRLFHLDLDEVGALRSEGLVSHRRFAPRCFRRDDHFGDPGQELADVVRARVEAATGARPRGPVTLLTQLRQLGVRFDPVSFFYCWTPERDALEAVVADVTNTPWGERHQYVLASARAAARGASLEAFADKDFHVSPFLGMDYAYRFRFGVPGDALHASIESHRGGELAFAASLALRKRDWSEARALRCAPLGTVLAIYAQALRLVLRGAPFHPHPRTAPVAPGATEPLS